MDKIFRNNIIIFIIIVLMLVGLYKLFGFDNEEHLSSTSNAVLSNEAVQNMGSVLNSGNGKINNLEILNSLKIGNLTIDNTGRIVWPGNRWTLGLEGDVMALRYNGLTDQRYAFQNDGFWTFGSNTITTGDVNAQNVGVMKGLYANGDLSVAKNAVVAGSLNVSGSSYLGGVVNAIGQGVILGGAADPNRCWMYQGIGDGYFHISPLNGSKNSWDYNQGLKFPIPKQTGQTTVVDGVTHDLGTSITPLRAAAGNDSIFTGSNGILMASNNDCVNYCSNMGDAYKALYNNSSTPPNAKKCFCKTSANTTYDTNNVDWITTKVK